MKKILIISYFYPQSSFVGGQRTAYWAENLHKFGYYPIVITRVWDTDQNNITHVPTNNLLQIKKYDTHEVHYLPFKQNFRDRIAKYKLLQPLQKINTLTLLLDKTGFRSFNGAQFYEYARTLIKKESTISKVIISGRPFKNFSIGYTLKNELNVDWIADYRDEWNSHQRSKLSSIMYLLSKIEKKQEEKWLSNALFFTTVSETGKNRISPFIKKEGYVVKNGFNKLQSETGSDTKKLTLTYVGTLYPYQPIEVLLNILKKLEKNNKDIIVNFVGIEVLPDQLKKVKKYNLKSIRIYNRMSHSKCLELLKNSDFGILTNYRGLDGCLPVKFFDYISLNKNILLIESDNGDMASEIKKLRNGFIVDNEEDGYRILTELISLKQANKPYLKKVKPENLTSYSRYEQTRKLGQILDKT